MAPKKNATGAAEAPPDAAATTAALATLATITETPAIELQSSAELRAETWRKLQNMDISSLKKEEHPVYLAALAHVMGLNPMMKPFITIPAKGGGLLVYITAGAADQLRDIRKLSSVPMYAGYMVPCWIDDKGDMQLDRETIITKDQYMVVWRVTENLAEGATRISYDIGMNPIGQAEGQGLSDMVMKTWTKAERRCVLGHAGVGFPEAREGLEGIGGDAFMPRIVEPQALPVGVSAAAPPPPVVVAVPPPPPPPVPPGVPAPVVVAPPKLAPLPGEAAPQDASKAVIEVAAAPTPAPPAPPQPPPPPGPPSAIARKPIPPPPVPTKQ